ncbi:MAG: monofunctional biosynthetic peptidoglycan transglycosylase [Saprospiraceae bacterium]|nr:monofunctional biosynthetic peptidoglycan transglycosylase [Saprospiraceae bacterium]MDW8483368.1 monofunctional biosynthetic peptidoglycan transglycosylase [Saprospiraceae bacterium]
MLHPGAGDTHFGARLRQLIFRFVLWFLGITVGLVLLYRFVPVFVTPLMVIRTIEQAFDDKRPVRWKHDWVPFEKLSPKLQLAVVCAEDQAFLEHWGFDFQAIEEAIEHNRKSRRIRGASTISQQTAKNVFLWPGRSWLRKGLEVYFTFLIETFWSKERIMTVYLNIIEFGDGIYGAEAASRHFFHKSASQLTREEAALLAAVLPNPLQRNPARPSSLVRNRQQWVLAQMRMWGGRINYEEPNTPRPKQ